jgi:hypothetical protein
VRLKIINTFDKKELCRLRGVTYGCTNADLTCSVEIFYFGDKTTNFLWLWIIRLLFFVINAVHSGTYHQADHLISDPIASGQNLNGLDSFSSGQVTQGRNVLCIWSTLLSRADSLFEQLIFNHYIEKIPLLRYNELALFLLPCW